MPAMSSILRHHLAASLKHRLSATLSRGITPQGHSARRYTSNDRGYATNGLYSHLRSHSGTVTESAAKSNHSELRQVETMQNYREASLETKIPDGEICMKQDVGRTWSDIPRQPSPVARLDNTLEI